MSLVSMPKDETKHRNGRRKGRIMTPEEAKNGKPSHWEELEITGTIKNLSPSLWQFTHLTVLYLNDNQLTRIPPDIKNLQNLHCLDLSSNKLRSLPSELGDLIKLRELMLNHNSLRVLPYELGKLFQLQLLGLNGNPLQKDIQNLYKNGTTHLLTYLLDNLSITTPEPPEREWVHSANPERTQSMAIFSVMSYNVLCDKYATRQLYGYCPPWALNWDYRRKIIMREILYYGADIVALQEVETCEYHAFFTPEMKEHGYEGIFSPKSRAKHMGEDERQHVDGCAIFWKTSKFNLVKEYLVEFNQVAMLTNEASEDMLNRVMTKDNIGIAALLETSEGLYDNAGFRNSNDHPKQRVLAANAHMHWDPEFSDVKLIQTVMLCHELKRICDEASPNVRPSGRGSTVPSECQKMPLVLCGDFNSLPESGVVEFLQSGKVSATHPDFREIKYSKCLSTLNHGLRTNGLQVVVNTFKDPIIKARTTRHVLEPYPLLNEFDPKAISHPFRLNSCYNDENYRLLNHSNHTYEFKGIIDYIFYSRTQLKCLGVLGGLDPGWFKANGIVGCPHPHVPSDHISLVTEFQLLPPGYQQQQAGSGGLAQQNGSFFNNHPQPYSLLFTQQQQQQQQPFSATTGGNASMTSSNFHQSQGRFSTPAINRPGSANSLTHSPINMLNGNNSGLMPSMGLHGGMGNMGMNGRR